MTIEQAEDATRWGEADRLEALLKAEILDTPPEGAFDDLVWLAKTLCDAPIA